MDADQPFSEAELTALFADRFGRWEVVVDRVHTRRQSKTLQQRVYGHILLDGETVGKFRRCVKPGERAVVHTSLALFIDARGKGFARQWIPRCRERYRAAGIERIDIDAIDDGRTVWAHMGFEIDDPLEWADTLDRALQLDGIDQAAVEALREGTPRVLALADVRTDEGSALAQLDWSGSMAA
jgi:GNAT superfamily N-acetyltransferase